jgi:hypothetical protein
MKQIVTFAALMLGLMLFGAPKISPAAVAPQATNHTHSHSGRATSNDRHARKHRASNHHHRHRTTAKSHSS